MIFVLVAGTYTPFAALVLAPALGWTILGIAWGGALAGVVLTLVWPAAPRWLNAVIYLALGWVSIVALPQLWSRAGLAAVALLASGGLLYTIGAIVYARRRPDPVPPVFGYHEVFHVLVIAAAAAHFTAVALYAR
jgi:hemolysin III